MLDEAIGILKEKSQTPTIRFDAILYIVDNFQSNCFPIFEEILNDETDHPDIRSAIALAIAKLGGQEALNILLKHAHTKDITLKNYIIQALGRLGMIEAAPTLVNALKESSNTIFASAADALGQLGQDAFPYLVDLLTQGADDARCVAAWKLGELGNPKAIPPLIQAIHQEKNIEIVALCVWALGEIGAGPPEVLEALEWGKTQAEPEIRLRAELAIKKIARHSN